MKIDGRTLDHATLEQIRLMAIRRVCEGEDPGTVIASVGSLLARLQLTPQKPLQRAYQRDPEAISLWQERTYPALARQAKRDGAQILFWDESRFRADTVHGKTWGLRGQTPVVYQPGQRQSISAASAVGPCGEFWFCTYAGGLNAELFVKFSAPADAPAQKASAAGSGQPAGTQDSTGRDYVDSTDGQLSLHFLPSYAPELNPDELVWSHVKRTGTARRPLQQGEMLAGRIGQQLATVRDDPKQAAAPFQLPTFSLAIMNPISMSVRRDMPRHMTRLPGGPSPARFK